MNGKRTRKQQIITMSVIAVAIVTLSIGFAAFSSTLRISSTAAVNPDSDSFSVIFSKDGTDVANEQTVSPNSSTYGDPATIENGAVPTISGLNAKFTAPGQTVTYSFYAKNTGAYLAYLNYITFNNVEGESTNKKCTASTGTTQSLVDSACNGINISVKVGNDEAVSTNQSGISNHILVAGTNEPVVVTISYTGTAQADGPFNVTFGDIELIYGSALGVGGESNTPSVATGCTYEDSADDTGAKLGTIDFADEVICGTESFYVMKNNGTTVEMMGIENLSLDETNPRQSATAQRTAFSTSVYWGSWETDEMLQAEIFHYNDQYKTREPEALLDQGTCDRDEFLESVYDSNSLIYKYLNPYEIYLKQIAPSITVTTGGSFGCGDEPSGLAELGLVSCDDDIKIWQTTASCDRPMTYHTMFTGEIGTYSSEEHYIRPYVTISVNDIK